MKPSRLTKTLSMTSSKRPRGTMVQCIVRQMQVCLIIPSIQLFRQPYYTGKGSEFIKLVTQLAESLPQMRNSLLFIQVPSKLEWNIHKEAHDYATSLIQPAGPRPDTSLDSVQKAITKRSQESWTRLFQDANYRGHNFMSLKKTDGSSLQLTYINGGVWLSPVGGDLTIAVRLFRCILNHAPIGSYYERFNIDESLDCKCGFRRQTHDHILLLCTKLERKDNWRPFYLKDLINFLEKNPSVFTFRWPLAVG